MAERGYELLRDREALAELIASAAADDPRILESERVAIALAPQDPCAHLIATVAGEGVTTLAAGMVHALPTVSFARAHAELERRATLLKAKIEVRKHVVEDDRSPLVRALLHPQRMTREEFDRLRKLGPVLSAFDGEYIHNAIQATIEVEPPRRPWTPQELDRLWRLYLRGVMFLTVEGFECSIRFLLGTLGAADVALSGRAIWHLANRPEETLAVVAELHAKGTLGPLSTLMTRTYALPALATRHPAYHKDAMRLATALEGPQGSPHLYAASEQLHVALTYPLLVFLPALIPAPWRTRSEATKERFDRTAHIVLGLLKSRRNEVALLELAEAVSPWHAKTIRALNPLRDVGAPRQTRVRSTSGLDEEESHRVALWRGLLWERPLPIRGDDPFMALLVSLAPLEALAPLDYPDPALSLSNGRVYLQRRLFQMKRMAELAIAAEKSGAQPAIGAPLTARNAPCLCGSGRKYKRCCAPNPRRTRRTRKAH